MTEPVSSPAVKAVTSDDIHGVRFQPSKAFGRGYDQLEVDSFLDRCAATVDELRRELQADKAEITRLQERIERDSRSNEVSHAISVLTSAQQTADRTVAQADDYSARVMSEARDLFEDARRNSATLEQETEEKARHVYEDALSRAATLERETKDKLAELTLSAKTAQQELDTQTAYLRTLRDASRTQIEAFLEGLLDHVAEEYGRAHPLAAEAANNSSPRRVRRPNRTPARTPSALRVAGQPDRRRQNGFADAPGIPAPRSAMPQESLITEPGTSEANR